MKSMEEAWLRGAIPGVSPLLAPVFAWNHDQVMAEGGRGLARHLGVALVAFHGSGEAR